MNIRCSDGILISPVPIAFIDSLGTLRELCVQHPAGPTPMQADIDAEILHELLMLWYMRDDAPAAIQAVLKHTSSKLLRKTLTAAILWGEGTNWATRMIRAADVL